MGPKVFDFRKQDDKIKKYAPDKSFILLVGGFLFDNVCQSAIMNV